MPEFDPRTLGLIEKAFGEELFVNHVTAARLLQLDRKEHSRLGDVEKIGLYLIGTSQREWSSLVHDRIQSRYPTSTASSCAHSSPKKAQAAPAEEVQFGSDT